MGLFGPSKREEELEAQLAEAQAEKAKLEASFEDWRKTTLAPHLKGLKDTISTQEQTLKDQIEQTEAKDAEIASQRSTLDSMGALEQAEIFQLLKKTRRELTELQAEAELKRTAMEEELRAERRRVQQEKATVKDDLRTHYETLRARSEAAYAEYRREYDERYSALTAAFEQKAQALKELEATTITVGETMELQSYGLFDYDNPAKSSVELSGELAEVKAKIKAMLKNNSAASVISTFTFNGSQSQGKRFANDMRKLMLRAYSAEAENAIKSVRVGNLDTAARRLNQTRETAQKLGEFIQLTIDPEFHRLRLLEIKLGNEHLKTLQAEKEIERERKAQLKEEERVEAEIRAKRKAEEDERKRIQRELDELRRKAEEERKNRLQKERDHYDTVIGALETGDSEEDLRALEAIEALQKKLADVNRAIEDLDYREANVRAGYVYVLSNIGTFGEKVVKIGMTRRLDPQARVKELSGASVPFIFDTHLMVFSDNARGLEHDLHKRFSAQRVNRINPRKEYFFATPDDVLAVLKEMDVAVVEFNREAEAADYRAGLAEQLELA